MGDRTEIAWTDATWNPLRGCSRVSEGCRNCYAEAIAARFSKEGQPYHGLAERTPDGPRWTGKVRLIGEKLDQPLRWTKPRRIFVNSMSDLFHESVPFETVAAIYGVMAAAPAHQFQVLTKRPRRAVEFFEWLDHQNSPQASTCAARAWSRTSHSATAEVSLAWPPPNVWLGVSAEDQATADERIPLLLQCPAAVRWVSAEPLLGPVDLELDLWPVCIATREEHNRDHDGGMWCDERCLDWVVVGGESGPGARPCDVEWIREVVAQCGTAGVPVFVKQLGARPVDRSWRSGIDAPHDRRAIEAAKILGYATPPSLLLLDDRKGGDPSEWPEDLRVREWPDD